MPKVKGKTGKGHYWQLDPHAKNQFNDSTVRRRPRGYRAIIQASKLTSKLASSTCPPGPVACQSSDLNSSTFSSSDSPTANYSTGYFNQATNSFYNHPNSACSATSSADYANYHCSSALNQPTSQQLSFLATPLNQSNQVSSTFDSAPEQQAIASSPNTPSNSFYSTTAPQITGNSVLLPHQPHPHHQLPAQSNLSNSRIYSSSSLTIGTAPCFTATTEFTTDFTADFTDAYPNLLSTRLVPVDASYAGSKADPVNLKVNQAKPTNPRIAYTNGYPNDKLIYSNVDAQKAYSLHREEHSIASYEPVNECKMLSNFYFILSIYPFDLSFRFILSTYPVCFFSPQVTRSSSKTDRAQRTRITSSFLYSKI